MRLGIEIFFRAVFLALIIYMGNLLFHVGWDFCDVIKRGYPTRMEATIVEEHHDGLTWWGQRTVYLKDSDGRIDRYDLWLHLTFPKEGRLYEVAFLPKSKCLLSLVPIGKE